MSIIKITNAGITGTLVDSQIPNLATSKITSGTFADARIAASNVSQHVTSFDDNKIINDLSTLGLRVHTQENLNASNTNSASFDVFQDSSGITNLTNCSRTSDEFVASVVAESFGTLQNFVANNWNVGSLGSHTVGDGTYSKSGSPDEDGLIQTKGATSELNFASGTPFQVSGVMTSTGGSNNGPWLIFGDDTTFASGNPDNTSTYQFGNRFTNKSMMFRANIGGNNSTFNVKTADGTDNTIYNTASSINVNGTTVLITRDTLGIFRVYSNGTLKGTSSDALTGKMHISLGSSGGSSSTCTITSFQYSTGIATVSNASGSFEGATITAGSSTSSMGAVVTYQDNAGTNTLNTDIVLKLSADNGSNYSTATLTALPDFATGIKMCKVNDLSVTAGTQLKYKLEFANQASGSKEARIRGVSLQY